MSEHTPLTEAAIEVLHDAGWYGRADLTTAQLDGIVNTLADAGLLAARTSTATADTGLRERVEALLLAWDSCGCRPVCWHRIAARELRDRAALKGAPDGER